MGLTMLSPWLVLGRNITYASSVIDGDIDTAAKLSNIDTTGMTSGNSLFLSLPFAAVSGSLDCGTIQMRNLATSPVASGLPIARASAGNAAMSVQFAAVTGTSAFLTVGNISTGVSDILDCSITYEVA